MLTTPLRALPFLPVPVSNPLTDEECALRKGTLLHPPHVISKAEAWSAEVVKCAHTVDAYRQASIIAHRILLLPRSLACIVHSLTVAPASLSTADPIPSYETSAASNPNLVQAVENFLLTANFSFIRVNGLPGWALIQPTSYRTIEVKTDVSEVHTKWGTH